MFFLIKLLLLLNSSVYSYSVGENGPAGGVIVDIRVGENNENVFVELIKPVSKKCNDILTYQEADICCNLLKVEKIKGWSLTDFNTYEKLFTNEYLKEYLLNDRYYWTSDLYKPTYKWLNNIEYAYVTKNTGFSNKEAVNVAIQDNKFLFTCIRKFK